MTQFEVYQALQAIKQPATKREIKAEMERQGVKLADISQQLAALVKNRYFEIHFKSTYTTYRIIAPFPERNVISAK